MYKDIINPHNEEEYYYHGSYLKPVYKCEDCNLSLTTADGENECEPCPMCGKSLKKELVPLEFCQSNDYATAISC